MYMSRKNKKLVEDLSKKMRFDKHLSFLSKILNLNQTNAYELTCK